jgi:O-antigen/teichoic acid export membrane protein
MTERIGEERRMSARSVGKLIELASSGRGVFGAVLQSVMTKGLVQILTILTGLITARSLGPHGRGVMTAIAMWPQLLAFLSTLGLPASVTYNIMARPADRGNATASACIFIVITSSLAAAIGALLIPFMLPGYSADDQLFARLLLLATPIVSAGMVLQNAAEAMGDFRASNMVRAVPVAITLVVILAFALSGHLTPYEAALIYAIPIIAMVGWLFGHMKDRIVPRRASFLASARAVLTKGIRYYPVDFFGTASNFVSQVIVVHTLAPQEVGIYAVSLSGAQLIEILYAPLSIVLLPRVAARDQGEAVSKTMLAARLNLILASAAIVPLALFTPEALRIFFGAAFVAAAPVIRLLVFKVLLSGTAIIMSQAFIGLGRPAVPTLLYILRLFFSLPILIVLTPRFGAVGAAAGVLAVSVFELGFMVACHRRLLGTAARNIVPAVGDLVFLRDLLRSLA